MKRKLAPKEKQETEKDIFAVTCMLNSLLCLTWSTGGQSKLQKSPSRRSSWGTQTRCSEAFYIPLIVPVNISFSKIRSQGFTRSKHFGNPLWNPAPTSCQSVSNDFAISMGNWCRIQRMMWNPLTAAVHHMVEAEERQEQRCFTSQLSGDQKQI